jgi:hypothetical protein
MQHSKSPRQQSASGSSTMLQEPTMNDTITKRQLDWIDNISRMELMRAPRQLLASWINHPHKAGCPQINYKNLFAEAIDTIVPASCNPVTGILKTWMPVAKRKDVWNNLIERWWEEVLRPPLIIPCLMPLTLLLLSADPATTTEIR